MKNVIKFKQMFYTFLIWESLAFPFGAYGQTAAYISGDAIVDSVFEASLHEMVKELPNQYWTDIVTEQPEGYVVDGNGNVHLYSAEALAWLISVTNGLNGQEVDDFEDKTIYLEENINLSAALWLPIAGKADVSAAFRGDFNGKEHVIDGLTMTSGPAYFHNMGLFGEVSGATISNIILKDGYFETHTASNCEGGFFANAVLNDSHIDHCFVECEMCTVEGMSPFVYMCDHSVISNCLVHSPLIRSEWDNGIPGILVAISMPNSHILNCASIIERMNWTENCGLIGLFNYGRIENCYGYIGECIDFVGYGGGLAPRNGVTSINEEGGEIYNCYYNRLRDYDEFSSSYYLEMDDQPASENLGVIHDALPFAEESRGSWKLTESISINLPNGTVSTIDLLDALNFKVQEIGDELLLNWCDFGMNFANQNLPVFCDFDVTEIAENTDDKDQVLIHPNPAKQSVTLIGQQIAEARLYSVTGQLVATKQGEGTESLTVDVSGLPSGLYFVTAIGEDGSRSVLKVVKE